jgi:hypothetical protein
MCLQENLPRHRVGTSPQDMTKRDSSDCRYVQIFPHRAGSKSAPSRRTNNNNNNNNNSMALDRQRNLPTERPTSVGEISANSCGEKGVLCGDLGGSPCL